MGYMKTLDEIINNENYERLNGALVKRKPSSRREWKKWRMPLMLRMVFRKHENEFAGISMYSIEYIYSQNIRDFPIA